MADIGSHWCDLAQHVSGQRIEAVLANLSTVVIDPGQARRKRRQAFAAGSGAGARVPITSEDLGTVLLRFSGGATGVVTVGQVCAGHKNDCWLEVCGRRGLDSLGAGAAERAVDRRPAPRQHRAGQGSVARLARGAALHASARRAPGRVGRRVLQRDPRHLRGDCRARAPRHRPPAFATFDDGYASACVVDAVLRSHAAGGVWTPLTIDG